MLMDGVEQESRDRRNARSTAVCDYNINDNFGTIISCAKRKC